MVEQEKHRQGYYDASGILKEMGIDNPTGKEALEYILGSQDEISDFVVYRYDNRPKRTLKLLNKQQSTKANCGRLEQIVSLLTWGE